MSTARTFSLLKNFTSTYIRSCQYSYSQKLIRRPIRTTLPDDTVIERYEKPPLKQADDISRKGKVEDLTQEKKDDHENKTTKSWKESKDVGDELPRYIKTPDSNITFK